MSPHTGYAKLVQNIFILSIYDLTDGLMRIVVQPQKDDPDAMRKTMFCRLTRLCWTQWMAMSHGHWNGWATQPHPCNAKVGRCNGTQISSSTAKIKLIKGTTSTLGESMKAENLILKLVKVYSWASFTFLLFLANNLIARLQILCNIWINQCKSMQYL